MLQYPETIKKLIDSFKMYPGIGPKNAERLALFTVMSLSKDDAYIFSKNISQAVDKIKRCDNCGMLSENEKCDVCIDSERTNKLMIVENAKDAIAFEKSGYYDGKYHILNGVLSPLNGIGVEDINISNLFERIDNEKIHEVIIATSSNMDGEMTAMYIKKILEKKEVKVYRIGYGLPVGADIEYADDITLRKAIEGKKEI